MAVLNIVHYGEPILRKKCAPVKDFSILDNLLDDMFDTMYEENGIGLAANQIGLDMNLFIIDISGIEEDEKTRIFINGKITDSKGESWFEEGCLSIPDIRLNVKRPDIIKFKYQDEKGQEFEEDFDGLLARAIQHEVDHLNGVFIVDRVSKSEKMSVAKELKDIEKNSFATLNSRKAFVL